VIALRLVLQLERAVFTTVTAMREAVIAILAGVLIAIVVVSLLVHFFP
jgi:hypothetical protein